MSIPTTPNTKAAPNRRQWLWLAVLVIALYVILPQLGGFRHSLTALRRANLLDILVAAAFTALTYCCAAATYCLLASKRLVYARTVLVQLAITFINRLLPAGIGGIGANYAYLRRTGHAPGEAGSVVAVNNLLGIVGHALLVVLSLSLWGGKLPPLHTPTGWAHQWLPALIGLVVLLLIGAAFFLRKRVRSLIAQATRQLRYYRRRPFKLLAALLTSMSLTLVTVSSLWWCTQALHGGLSFVVVLLVFSFGQVVGTATPTPGGLGGIEAGLVAGLVAYHMPSGEALAAVLVYRLLSYWLALAAGALAFSIVQRRGYLDKSLSRATL
jgi:uncharacterized membrane protein YbhN (UPF0104 family)